MQKQDLKTVERLTNENSTYPKIPFGMLIEECMKDYLEYRKSEEKGLLFQFPCKVGDTVYAIFSKNNILRHEECEVEQIIIHAGVVEMNVLIKMDHIRSRLDMELFGKTVFLTLEGAEKALVELSNKTEC